MASRGWLQFQGERGQHALQTQTMLHTCGLDRGRDGDSDRDGDRRKAEKEQGQGTGEAPETEAEMEGQKQTRGQR